MKNVTILFLFAALIFTGMNSCKMMGGKQKTLNGFDVEFIQDEKGDLAKEGDYVYFRYYVMYKDSLIFSSMMQSPIVKYKVPKLEKTDIGKALPIAEVLHMMSKGDSVIVYQKITEEMKKSINLPMVDILAFHVMLEDIKNEADYKKDAEADQKIAEEKKQMLASQSSAVAETAKKILEDYKSNKLKSAIIETPSGLKYIVIEAGKGPKAQVGKPVSVNYYGMLMDGTRFDDSWSRGQEFTFPLGQSQVIKGWDEGIANLNEGAKAAMFIPANLAYGAEGSPPVIPANSELVFYIEVNKVN